NSYSFTEGGTLVLSGAFSDPLEGQTHTVVINWGDGSANTTLPLAAGVFTFSAAHRYPEEGNDTLRVTVTADGGGRDTLTLPVTTNSVVPPSGLVDWWTGDGTNAFTAPDIAGTNPGTLNGGVTFAPGLVGNAFSFNGTSTTFVNIPDAPSLNINSGAT